jgi:hypothetical protein
VSTTTFSGFQTLSLTHAGRIPCGLDGQDGRPLERRDLVDFDLCWGYNLADPWGNEHELNCYDSARIRAELVEAERLTPARYWPAGLHAGYRGR